MNYFHELAAPFRFEGKGENKNKACLLIHGFTGTPGHLRDLGEALNREGFTVEGILLPGHGTTPEDMEKAGWKDWLNYSREACARLENEYDEVNVVGFSMGGVIALILAAEYPSMKHLALISPALKLKNRMTSLTPVAKYFMRFNPIVPPTPKPGEKPEMDIGYRKTPIRCVPHLLKLQGLARRILKKVTVPVMIFQSMDDDVVSPESGDRIYSGIKSNHKELVKLVNSIHVATIGLDRDILLAKIPEFFNA